ncbi:MAG: HD-GYP domain-containing protein [Paenibacillus macerans]|uniref:HD-GYP domain-containing protein n=1 Tax=Paenibacillus macerans TaxID=44252 RepID=UPI0029085ABB|nr:HD-GYP domain-containing protein [Paenibacillus macerans]MDU7476675.1 HD-GYP domain-containing protein [Paenibacillus macerans]
MRDSNETSLHFIGRKVNKDIFSEAGALLLSESMVITQEHLATLENRGIILTEDDLAAEIFALEDLASPQAKIVDDAVQYVNEIFNEVRETKKVPLAEIRKSVIPAIHEMTQATQLIRLFAALQAKDDYTYRHNIAVGTMSNLLGGWMGLDHRDLLQLTAAAFLHDIGKTLIPDEILNKPGALTAEEFAIMKNHTVFGYEILKDTVGVNHRQALVALQHHERMDGSGYPLGITAEKIDLFSRIVAVVDIFHAMTSKRVYRDPAPFNEVLDQMEKDAFGPLDPSITKMFVEKMMHSLIGSPVVLTDDRKGIVVMLNPHDLTHPLIRTEDGYVDLSKDLSVHIKRIF